MATMPSAVRRTSAPAGWIPVDLGEPLPVRLGHYASAPEAAARLRELPGQRLPNLTLVLVAAPELGRLHLAGLVDLATSTAPRVILTAPAEAEAGPLRAATAGRWPALVQVEPEVGRAIPGALLSAGPDEAVAVLWPEALGEAAALVLIDRGGYWRSAWEAPDEGEL
jgi:hypothetical protein